MEIPYATSPHLACCSPDSVGASAPFGRQWVNPDARPQQGAAGLLGCWADADKGDSADLKLMFQADGLLVQYDENQVQNKKRTFGAWDMDAKSAYLTVY